MFTWHLLVRIHSRRRTTEGVRHRFLTQTRYSHVKVRGQRRTRFRAIAHAAAKSAAHIVAGACALWRWPGSNRRPPACKAGALPAELHPRVGRCAFACDAQSDDVRAVLEACRLGRGPFWIRTRDLTVISRALLPTELKAHDDKRRNREGFIRARSEGPAQPVLDR